MNDETTQGQPGGQRPLTSNQKLAQQPEKALLYIWLLLIFGLVQRFVMPALAGPGGVLIIAVPLVLLVLVGPSLLAGVVLYHNKKITDKGKAWFIGSAALVTIFGIYLFAWAI